MLTARLLSRLAFHPLAFAEDFLEGPDFCEKHIARRAARLSVWADVVGLDKPGQKCVSFEAKVFEPKHTLEVALLLVGNSAA